MRVSIIITTYNYGEYLESAIKSALNQDFPRSDYEIIVVDDGSSDTQTQEVLNRYRKDIFLLQRKNRGLSISCNDAAKVSSGRYLVRLDADDEFLPDFLKQASGLLEERTDVDFVYSNYIEKSPEGERLIELPEFAKEEVKKRGDFLAIGTMYRREIFSQVGLFDENLQTLEHYDLVLRAIAGNKKGYRIGKPLFIYTKKAGSMSTDSDKMLRTGKELGDKYGFTYQQNENMP